MRSPILFVEKTETPLLYQYFDSVSKLFGSGSNALG
jgi:hypothetical protein